MKNYLQKILLLLLSACFFSNSVSYGQQANSLQQESILLKKVLEKNHYNPRKVDDKLAEQIFKQFINLLDPDHLYFTATDVKQLSFYSQQIDDELNGKAWNFLPQVTAIYKQRLLQSEKICDELLAKPFSFTSIETLTFANPDSVDFATSEKEQVQRWNKWLKYQTLKQLVNLYDESNIAEFDKSSQVLAKEPAMRQKVQVIEKRNIKRIVESPEGFENYVGSLFFHAITTCFDPHTSYLSKTDRENFESALSTEALSFGIDLEENTTGDIAIARLVPGGPAWKSNELHKGDILTSLKWQGKTALDLMGVELGEVESIMATSNSGSLELTVRKTSGIIKMVSLVKEKLRADENIVKSFMLKGEKKIGYISLPGFYTEWEDASSQGCANDVAKEIVKLKQENIDGLILDIRFNGGGSLTEGVNLAGIFINEGPLCVLQHKEGKLSVMKDMNRGTIYDGPLVLMVNGQSASASEVLASTLQDYNRAVIVGSVTFGKATGQVILPLDTTKRMAMVQRSKSKPQTSFSKITVSKLYRVTGRSAQLKGVIPDVILPDIYQNFEYREASFPFPLSSDSISKKINYTALKALPVKELSHQSTSRVVAHPSFEIIKKINAEKPDLFGTHEKSILLSLSHFKNKALETYQWYQMIDKVREKSTDLYTVENNGYDKELMHIDTYGKEINDLTIKNIGRSIYIEETYRIITDLINTSK